MSTGFAPVACDKRQSICRRWFVLHLGRVPEDVTRQARA